MTTTVIIVLFIVGVVSLFGAWRYNQYYWIPTTLLYAILGLQLFVLHRI